MFAQEVLAEGSGRLPRWVAGAAHRLGAAHPLKATLRKAGLVTVCEEARCPNMVDCFGRGVATFMILGDTCTRSCAFCSVGKGRPGAMDTEEPYRLARAARQMGLRHVVVTSVNRDDLPDGGAGAFVQVIEALRAEWPAATVEVLTPDFAGTPEAVEQVASARPEVYNHNLETVPRLYPEVRPGADYRGSLRLLARVREVAPETVTKSGVMVGLGETDEELLEVFRDLLGAGCDVLTVGQYLRPTTAQRPVSRYLTPGAFGRLREAALRMGFRHVAAGPRVRSSFNAGALLEALAR